MRFCGCSAPPNLFLPGNTPESRFTVPLPRPIAGSFPASCESFHSFCSWRALGRLPLAEQFAASAFCTFLRAYALLGLPGPCFLGPRGFCVLPFSPESPCWFLGMPCASRWCFCGTSARLWPRGVPGPEVSWPVFFFLSFFRKHLACPPQVFRQKQNPPPPFAVHGF